MARFLSSISRCMPRIKHGDIRNRCRSLIVKNDRHAGSYLKADPVAAGRRASFSTRIIPHLARLSTSIALSEVLNSQSRCSNQVDAAESGHDYHPRGGWDFTPLSRTDTVLFNRCNRMDRECIPAIPKPRKRRTQSNVGESEGIPLLQFAGPSSRTPQQQQRQLPPLNFNSPPNANAKRLEAPSTLLSRHDLSQTGSHSFVSLFSRELGNNAVCFVSIMVPTTVFLD